MNAVDFIRRKINLIFPQAYTRKFALQVSTNHDF